MIGGNNGKPKRIGNDRSVLGVNGINAISVDESPDMLMLSPDSTGLKWMGKGHYAIHSFLSGLSARLFPHPQTTITSTYFEKRLQYDV